MDIIKSLLNDMLNGMSVNDIPIYLVRLFLSGLIAFILKLIYNKAFTDDKENLMRYVVGFSIVLSAVIPLAQYSISFGIIISALLILLSKNITFKSNKEVVFFVLTLFLSSTIGLGYVIYGLIGFIITLVYILISKD